MDEKQKKKEWFNEKFNKPLTEIQQSNLKSIYKPPMSIKQLYDLYNEMFDRIYTIQIREWLKINRPPKELTEDERKVLEDLYYKQHNYFGIQKLYTLAKEIIPIITRKKVKEWVQQQKIYQLHKPINFKVRNTKSFKSLSSSTLAIDLIDMTNRQIKHYKYILTCIDIFSKYTYLFPIASKTPQNIEKCVEEILKEHPFKVIITDNGTEFNIKKLEGVVKIVKTQTYNPTNNAIVERQNRNVRNLLRHYFEDNKNWVEVLPTLQKNINNTYQRTIKDTPYNVFKNYNEEQLEKLRERLEKDFQKNKILKEEIIYKVNDNVRVINKIKQKTKDKHLSNWSKDTYIIYKIIPANENVLTRYKLINTSNGKIEVGTFNGSQLQLIKGIQNPPKK